MSSQFQIDRSCSRILFIDKISSGSCISCLLFLLLAIHTIPFFRQVFFLDAARVEPFPFTIRIFTSHHFTKRCPSTVAILWLFIIVIKLLFLVWSVQLICIQLHLLSLQYLFLRFILIFILQLVGKHLLILVHLMIELICDLFFLFGKPKDLFLLLHYLLVLGLQSRRHFVDLLFLEFFDLEQEFSLLRAQSRLQVFDSLIQFSDQSQKSVNIIWDCDHLIHKIIEICAIIRGHFLFKLQNKSIQQIDLYLFSLNQCISIGYSLMIWQSGLWNRIYFLMLIVMFTSLIFTYPHSYYDKDAYYILKIFKNQISKMNNRNSYLTNRGPKTNSVERPTFNPTSVTKTDKPTSDKVITKILDVINKLQNQTGIRVISRQTLKNPSSKTFYDVANIFLRSIDNKFERVETTYETVISALQIFGYQGNMHKNIFHPIGPLHTWGHILAILQFLAELAAFSFNFQAVIQQKAFEYEDQNTLLLQSSLNENRQMMTNYFDRQCQTCFSEIEQMKYSIDSQQMAIRNQHNAQKDIQTVDKDLQKEKELAYRTKQETVQMQANLKECQYKVLAIDQNIRIDKQNQKIKEVALSNLRYEVTHQVLPPEECEKLKLEIKDIKNRVAKIKENTNHKIENHRKQVSKMLQNFVDCASELTAMKQKLKSCNLVSEIDPSFQIPTVDIFHLNDLTNNLKIQSNQFDQIVQRTLKQDQFEVYLRRQEDLISNIEQRLSHEEQQFVNKQEVQERLQQNIMRKEMRLEEIRKRRLKSKSKNEKNQKEIFELTKQISKKQTEKYELELKAERLKQTKQHQYIRSKETIQQIKKIKRITSEFEKEGKEMIATHRQEMQIHKEKCYKMLLKNKQFIVNMNRQLAESYQKINQ